MNVFRLTYSMKSEIVLVLDMYGLNERGAVFVVLANLVSILFTAENPVRRILSLHL
jgi:hypothetical protein